MRAIQMTEFGGPEVLELVELPVPEPAPDEVLIEVSRAGLNFADTHTRTNSYVQKATLPLVPGGGGGGQCARTPASASSRWSAAAATPSTRPRPASACSRSPTELDDGTALALIVQGTTAWHLYRTAGPRGRGRERGGARRGRRRRLAGGPARARASARAA